MIVLPDKDDEIEKDEFLCGVGIDAKKKVILQIVVVTTGVVANHVEREQVLLMY